MYNRFKNLKKQEKGQGLVEYALILVLVAIVVIAALSILGPQISSIFTYISNSLSVVGSGTTPPSGSIELQGSYGADCQALNAAPGQTIYYDWTNGTVSASNGTGFQPFTCN